MREEHGWGVLALAGVTKEKKGKAATRRGGFEFWFFSPWSWLRGASLLLLPLPPVSGSHPPPWLLLLLLLMAVVVVMM